MVIYDPLSSEIANLYIPISDNKVAAAGLVVFSFLEEVFGEGLNVITGGVFTSDTDTLMNNGQVAGFADMDAKVVNGILAVNRTNFPVLFSYLDITENNAKNFVEKATLNGANYILLGNHYNEALRQAFNGSKEFAKAISLGK